MQSSVKETVRVGEAGAYGQIYTVSIGEQLADKLSR